jgi:limonene-1,2-epoxide hydrolase
MLENTNPKNHEKAPMLEPLTTERIRELWSRTYNREGKPDWSHIFPYYHDDIVFEDSIQRVEGKAAFMAMCARLAERCKQLNMDIHTMAINGSEVLFDWTMVMSFQKYPPTPLHGCTRLTLDADSRIIRQRDYFDLWGTILNGIPLLRKGYWKFMHRYFG